LCRSLWDGKIVDRPPQTVERYVVQGVIGACRLALQSQGARHEARSAIPGRDVGACHPAVERRSRTAPVTPSPTLEHPRTTQARLTPRISALLVRIQSKYREMPGLKLTEAQACRLWDPMGPVFSSSVCGPAASRRPGTHRRVARRVAQRRRFQHPLRKWFNHDHDRWPTLRARYLRELDSRPDAWRLSVSHPTPAPVRHHRIA